MIYPFNFIINWVFRHAYLEVDQVTNVVISLDTNKDGRITVSELIDALTGIIGKR